MENIIVEELEIPELLVTIVDEIVDDDETDLIMLAYIIDIVLEDKKK